MAKAGYSHFSLPLFACFGGFAKLIQKKIEQGGFSHHPKCKALKLSQLAFANDPG